MGGPAAASGAAKPAAPPSAPGAMGLPDLGFSLGGTAPASKASGSPLDTDFGLPGLDLPSFDLGASSSPAAPPKLPTAKASPAKPASFLDESPSAGASLGFDVPAAEDVLGLGHKVEKSILDDMDSLAQPTAVVESGSKKKFIMLTLAVAAVVVLAFGGLWMARYSLRQALKGMVLNGALSRADKVKMGEGVDLKTLRDSLGSLRGTAVPNRAVEIYDIQVLSQDLKSLTRDGVLEWPEFERLQARITYLKSIKSGR